MTNMIYDLFLTRLRYATKMSSAKVVSSRVDLILSFWNHLKTRICVSTRLEYLNIIEPHLGSGLSNAEYFDYSFEPGDWDLLGQLMADLSLEQRQRALIWRISAEATHRESDGWFMLFWTLTVADRDPDHLRGEPWKDFTRNLRRITAKSVHGVQKPNVPAEQYFSYVAVVEGIAEGNPHIHAITFHKDVPDSWKRCPNIGRRVPNYLEIAPPKAFWSFGFVSPRPLRTGPHDAWARVGFTWPVKKGKPLKVMPSSCVGSYLGKYLAKEKGIKGWRSKISRQLGLSLLRTALNRLSPSMIRKISRPYLMAKFPKLPQGSPPATLIRSLSKKLRLKRIESRRSLLAIVRLRQMKSPLGHGSWLSLIRTLEKRHKISVRSSSTLSSLLSQVLGEVADEYYLFLEEVSFHHKHSEGISGAAI